MNCEVYRVMHLQENIMMQIVEDGKELSEEFSYANYWTFNRFFYMDVRLFGKEDISGSTAYVQEVDKVTVKLYGIVYPEDDMVFEELRLMCMMHREIGENEISLGNIETVVRYVLTRALEYVEKPMPIKEYDLKHPPVMNWNVLA